MVTSSDFANLLVLTYREDDNEASLREGFVAYLTLENIANHHQNVYAAGDKILVPSPVQVRQSPAIESA